MLTRPGSESGPEWMRKLGSPEGFRHAYGPGIALGYHEASGKRKESLFG